MDTLYMKKQSENKIFTKVLYLELDKKITEYEDFVDMSCLFW